MLPVLRSGITNHWIALMETVILALSRISLHQRGVLRPLALVISCLGMIDSDEDLTNYFVFTFSMCKALP